MRNLIKMKNEPPIYSGLVDFNFKRQQSTFFVMSSIIINLKLIRGLEDYLPVGSVLVLEVIHVAACSHVQRVPLFTQLCLVHINEITRVLHHKFTSGKRAGRCHTAAFSRTAHHLNHQVTNLIKAHRHI